MSKPKVNPKRGPNYLPAHIGASFQGELLELIENLERNAHLEASFGLKGNAFKEAYLKEEVLSKYLDEGLVPADDRSAAALAKWLAAEETNTKTNQRLLIESCDFGWTTSDLIDDKVRSIVSDILGPVPYPLNLQGGQHSNGASTRVGRGVTSAIQKCTSIAHVSSSAMNHWGISTLGSLFRRQPVTVRESSVFFTVPKKTEIDRVACKEPEVNMILQRTVGKHIRRQLKGIGIDLRKQENNQLLARDALKLGLATVDLSAASDSITEQLVVNWLPPEWFCLLNDLRVKSAELPDGSTHPLQMFSSMGNGFTFELETLLFYALTRAIAWITGSKGKISVYGDDIICPANMVPALRRSMFWYGFKVNPKKSNWTGLFRESCGKHYYDSEDVSPFYIREPVTRVEHMIRLLNRLLEWDSCSQEQWFHTREVALFHQKWSKQVSTKLWGGTEPEATTALVTGHSPQSRLVRGKRGKPYSEKNMRGNTRASRRKAAKDQAKASYLSYDHYGALLHWFCSRAETEAFEWVSNNPFIWLQDVPNWLENQFRDISVTPIEDTAFKLERCSRWTERTTWTPYYLYPEYELRLPIVDKTLVART